ncbi:MAG: hypothetical protein Q9208_002863 [Pyrenodesmia sp. 3 TL-2023]
MPITIKTAAHGADHTHMDRPFFAASAQDLYFRGQPRSANRQELLQSSFSKGMCEEQNLFPSPNGFVYGAIEAYNQHHHLTIRPEDVWFAILSQFGCWLNKAAEDVRKMFVAHDGKKGLSIYCDDASRFTVDFGDFAKEMTKLIAENIVDPGLREWMMPCFSTTTETDTVVASVLMMGALQPYFSYECRTFCGIPSVTLMGVRSDWEVLLGRLDKLATFGKEPAKFATLLRPLCERFVDSFTIPTSEKGQDFWQLIVSEVHEESGKSYYNGWITAFCFWDQDGNNLYDQAYPAERPQSPASAPVVLLSTDLTEFCSDIFDYELPQLSSSDDNRPLSGGLVLDGVRYHSIQSDAVPPGSASVPVKLVDFALDGKSFQTSLIAGSVGIQYTASRDSDGRIDGDGSFVGADCDGRYPGSRVLVGHGLDSVQPVLGWWMFIDKEEAGV